LTEDHVVPLSLGGSNDIDNIQPLCKSCNSSKRGRHIDYRLPVARSHCEIDQ
jgi:5-methylcytosine-specific restriction endonuclease McrA